MGDRPAFLSRFLRRIVLSLGLQDMILGRVGISVQVWATEKRMTMRVYFQRLTLPLEMLSGATEGGSRAQGHRAEC